MAIWQFWRSRSEMRDIISPLNQVLVHPFTASYLAFVFIPSSTIVATPHTIIASEKFSFFAFYNPVFTKYGQILWVHLLEISSLLSFRLF